MKKTFTYTWTQEFYLLHFQFNLPDRKSCEALITRTNGEGKTKKEKVIIREGLESHRILVSRSHPSEKTVKVDYPENVTLEVFQLDDRAYYPTESYFVG